MSRLFHSLFVLLATASQQELARQIRYLKAENEVLRSKLPKRVDVTQGAQPNSPPRTETRV
jgi:putative transposase